MDKATPTPESPPVSPPQQVALHQDDAADDDENVKQLKECSTLYLSLQDCLIKSNRNWKSCQMEVQALKACNERRKK
ncbi:hypothetical protein CXB51_025664 [Gossypium anomalum]|uniref:CHCH domain-containing protein n=1 Tax=Gossypium anomalum TaxID=47600 RepID=A0A8J6CSN8_9ROSI|nr:hypothetical protein CXB51_025664 [Gossypium anomalum]